MITTQEADTTYYIATSDELRALIRQQPSGTRFYVTLRGYAPIVDEAGAETNREFPDGLYYAKRVSRRDALFIAADILSSTLQARGGRIKSRLYVSQPGGRYLYRAFYVC